MKIYLSGRAAFHQGIACDKSPYPDPLRRIPWLKGWFDSRDDHITGSARVAAVRPGPLLLRD